MQSPEEQLNQNVRLYSVGQTKEAVAGLNRLLTTYPYYSLAHYNLGTIYKNTQQPQKAISHFQLALKFDHTLVPAYNNLALCLKDRGNLDQAVRIYRQALKIAPENTSLHHNLGNVYREMQRFPKAVDSYLKALYIQTNNPDLYADLASTYLLQNRYLDAQKGFTRALTLAPNTPRFHLLLGHAYYKNNQFAKARDCYQRTVSLDPNYDLAYSCLFMAKRRICDWEGLNAINDHLDATHNQDPWGSVVRSENPLFNLLTAKSWSKRIESSVVKPHFIFTKTKNPHRKIRLGYISGNFADHPVGYMTLALINGHYHKHFDVFAYSYGPDDNSKCRKNIEKLADQFVDLNGFTDIEAAQKINSDKIDILIDLMGYTEGNRQGICALRPAPIQVAWAELLGTSGASFFDYILVDKIIVPRSQQKYYTEKLFYLPKCSYFRQSNPQPTIKKFTRKEFNLPKNGFVFGVFHQMFKLEPEVWQIWMNILKAVPDSVLWLWKQNPDGANNLKKYAKQAGINPQRLIFSPTMGADDFFSRLSLADMALDTFIYGGGITTLQTLAAGVPVITLCGTHMASRLGASILTFAQIPELIARNPQDYQNLAVSLAQNREKLAKIKPQLPPPAIKDLERAYIKLISTYSKI